MKIKLPTWVAVIICLLLVFSGLSWTVVGSYAKERTAVASRLQAGNALSEALSNRGSDGKNLCVIARRYLSVEDEQITILEKAADKLMRFSLNESALEEAVQADRALTAAFSDVASSLSAFSLSQRDQEYLNYVQKMLGQDDPASAVQAYNTAAKAFNEKLEEPLNGFLPRLFGIKPCRLYE